MDAKQVIKQLGLQPNPVEGGYFASTYNSSVTLPDKKPLCNAIFYFLDTEGFSALHRVKGDMLYHFYAGDPVEMLLLKPGGSHEIYVFSNDLAAGGKPMKEIPGGTWLGSRLARGGKYALMGVTMAPGYVKEDYELGKREELEKQYPDVKGLIRELTKG